MPLSESFSDPCEELDDEAVDGFPELDDELLELGIEGEERDDEEEALGIDGAEGEDDDEELGIDGAEGEDGEDDELGIDGMEDELLELDWVDSQPPSIRPRATATPKAFSDGYETGLLIL